MMLPFSELPGRHERHLRRKFRNPLFPVPVWTLTEQELLDVRRKDHEEVVDFLGGLRDLVQRAVELRHSEESRIVRALNTELDRAYERACGLADDQSGNKEAIRKLIAVITAAIRTSTAGDPSAERELEAEEEARRIHFQLLELPLVADLLDEESLIEPAELAPTLLTETAAAVRGALELFDAEQVALLCREARSLLEGRDWLPVELSGAAERLALLESRREMLVSPRPRRDAGRG